MIQNIVLTIAYDGSCFYGWQKTADGPSIEETLCTCLETILQESVVLQAASRTDRGVHAEGQIVNFFTQKQLDLGKLQYSLNSLLPPEIRILNTQKASKHFHPTLDNLGKEYHYCICLGPIQLPHHRYFSWHVPYVLNKSSMIEAARSFIGEKDFTSFCNVQKQENFSNKRRYLEAIELIDLPHNRLQIAVKGNHFLYKMVRIIVGTLVYVGRGKIKPEDIPTILSNQSRPLAGMTAPAHGLILKKIYYKRFI